jgi:chromosomal replication initiation ATPase DnaA
VAESAGAEAPQAGLILLMPSQLPLPLGAKSSVTRDDFIVAPANAEAIAFIDAWPDWPVAAAALCGPPGSGKTHLVEIWKMRSSAQVVAAAALEGSALARLDPARPVAIEGVDSTNPNPARDSALFELIEKANRSAPVLLTGHEPPAAWPTVLPDLASRFSSLLSFPLWAPDDDLLSALARKLFTDRQLQVPDTVIVRMVQSLERTPGAVRAFVAEADAKALAEGRSITPGLVRELLEARETRMP